MTKIRKLLRSQFKLGFAPSAAAVPKTNADGVVLDNDGVVLDNAAKQASPTTTGLRTLGVPGVIPDLYSGRVKIPEVIPGV